MITEKDLELELLKQVELTESASPPLEGMSVFAHHYVETYRRTLPATVLFDDVREKVADTARDIAFLSAADNELPWAALYVFFEHMFLPRLTGGVPATRDKLLDFFGMEGVPYFRTASLSSLDFATLVEKLAELEENQTVEGMEDLLRAVDKGLGALQVRGRETSVGVIRVARFFFNSVFEGRPPNATGALLGIVNSSYYLAMEGDAVLRQLEQEVRTV